RTGGARNHSALREVKSRMPAPRSGRRWRRCRSAAAGKGRGVGTFSNGFDRVPCLLQGRDLDDVESVGDAADDVGAVVGGGQKVVGAGGARPDKLLRDP